MSPRSWKLPYGIKTIEVNGYEMAYLERGQGTPLVLVHGSLNDYRAWALQIEPFSAVYRSIAVSLRHSYPECWNGEGDKFSVSQHVDDLSVFVKKLKAGPVHLVAHSRGGDIALILAKKHPELVRSMVLADPAPLNEMLPKTPEINEEVENRKAFVTAAIERLKQGDLDTGLKIFTNAVSFSGSWQKLSESAKQIRRDNAWSLKSLVTDAQEKFNCADAKKIDAPVLLVTGDKSPRLYGMMHAALQRCLKIHQKVTILNASHGMNRENPEAFNAAVLQFLLESMAQQEAPPD
jgi:pimeloyl-ACP methyl ester carboxylesterase